MNMNINLVNVNAGIDASLVNVNLVNATISKKDNEKYSSPSISNDDGDTKKPKHVDYKTTLGSWGINEIDKITDDVNTYFFIQKNKESSSWNLVAPIVFEKSTKRIIQYGLGYFALEGFGGGLNNTKQLISKLMSIRSKGIKVNFIPRVIDNELIRAFQYVDSNVTLDNLIDRSTDLLSYDKREFIYIRKTYDEIMKDYNGTQQL
jgi:hypothetical protein